MRYFNNLSEPNGQVSRRINIDLTGPVPSLNQPCTIIVAVINAPDPPVIHLPDR